MACPRPCYDKATFDYRGMACFLEKNMGYRDTGLKVVIMLKDKSRPGKFKYVEKPVMHIIPNTTDKLGVIAYISPGYDNSYYYMYLLTKGHEKGKNYFTGEHFTMGLKNGYRFDLHYTCYDYKVDSIPSHLYYKVYINKDTTPHDVSKLVCSATENEIYDDTLYERCFFFDNLMKYVHNNDYCINQFRSEFRPHTMNMNGGKKTYKKKQHGGYNIRELTNIDEVDEPFRKLIQLLEDKIGDIPNLQSIEMHIMNNNKGILTYSIDDNNVESMHISVEGVQKHNGKFTTYYTLPFDFKTYEFISIEELVQNIDKSIPVNHNNMRVPLEDIVICENNLDYSKIIEMTKYPMTEIKSCRNVKRKETLFHTLPMPISVGGKNKKLDKIKKSKDFPSFKFA